MASKIISLIKPTSPVTLLLLLLLLPLLPLFSLAALASPSFQFLSKLQGLKKGDTAQEISQLRKYLNHFGYLNNSNIQTREVNVFDESISLAIKTYQTFYNLKPSGTLDEETVSKMMAPRCGVPDTGMHHTASNNNTNNPQYVFFPDGSKWPPSKRSLTYALSPEDASLRSYAMAPIASALEEWRKVVPSFTFTRIEDFYNADIRISFKKGDHGDGLLFDGPGGVLAHAFSPTDGTLHFDVEENWVVGAVAGGFDIGTVALHEIGHILGLDHTPDQNAIMYAFTKRGTTKGLSDDDRQGIRALYGS